jgi:hypothetical protein
MADLASYHKSHSPATDSAYCAMGRTPHTAGCRNCVTLIHLVTRKAQASFAAVTLSEEEITN